LRTYQETWKQFANALTSSQFAKRFQTSSAVRFVGKFGMAALLGVLFLSVTLGLNVGSAHAAAQTSCAGGDRVYVVVRGDTLSRIASRYGTSWGVLASYNHIANPNVIYTNQVICIPGNRTGSSSSGTTSHGTSGSTPLTSSSSSAVGHGNPYPYPACTWWADQRYYQIHGYFVPWTTNSNAWQWTARAYQFGWHVSSAPVVGSIIDLQPWVQGAYGEGHVAVVEQVLSNGHVIASNMSWGANPYQVRYVEFAPGPGVTFIYR
jgi:surface antigen